MILFSLPSYEYLARQLLKLSPLKRGHLSVARFPNQEIYITVKTNVDKKKCIVLGATAPPDENLITTLLLSHTLKKEGASKVTALIPYLGYSRHDKNKKGESLGISLIGEMLKASGIDTVVTLDVHSKEDKQLFPIPLISLDPTPLFVQALSTYPLNEFSLVAPDEGAISRCRTLKQAAGISREIIHLKKRRTPKGIIISALERTVARRVIVLDDILDTGETLIRCCEKLQELGVTDIIIIVTHGVFSGTLWKKLWSLGVKHIYTTDTVLQDRLPASKKITILKISPLIKKYFINK